MPYKPSHRATVREAIIRAAAALFNSRGYGAVSIDDVMARAGLTRGGFYLHFRSKAELHLEAMRFILKEHPAAQWEGVDFDLAEDAPRKVVDAYLSEAHAADLERSCPLVTQAPDAARGSPELQQAYREVLEAMVSIFPAGASGTDRSDLPHALAALCVGGLTLSRGVGDEALARRIRAGARAAAHKLLDVEAERTMAALEADSRTRPHAIS
jgi:AcrR family transcriptional regulator